MSRHSDLVWSCWYVFYSFKKIANWCSFDLLIFSVYLAHHVLSKEDELGLSCSYSSVLSIGNGHMVRSWDLFSFISLCPAVLSLLWIYSSHVFWEFLRMLLTAFWLESSAGKLGHFFVGLQASGGRFNKWNQMHLYLILFGSKIKKINCEVLSTNGPNYLQCWSMILT